MNKINVTDARKDMSTFFDNVIHEKPIILKKRKYEGTTKTKSSPTCGELLRFIPFKRTEYWLQCRPARKIADPSPPLRR